MLNWPKVSIDTEKDLAMCFGCGQDNPKSSKASKAKADIAHFPECALSGYVGTDFGSFDRFNWQLLHKETEKITALAGQLGLRVVLGSTHKLTKANKPHSHFSIKAPRKIWYPSPFQAPY